VANVIQNFKTSCKVRKGMHKMLSIVYKSSNSHK